MKPVVIGVVGGGVAAAIVVAVLVTQSMTTMDLQRQQVLDLNLQKCDTDLLASTLVSTNIDWAVSNWEECSGTAFDRYGNEQQRKFWESNKEQYVNDLLTADDQPPQILPRTYNEAEEFVEHYTKQMEITCKQLHPDNNEEYENCMAGDLYSYNSPNYAEFEGMTRSEISTEYFLCLDGVAHKDRNCDNLLNEMLHPYCLDLQDNSPTDRELNLCKNRNFSEIKTNVSEMVEYKQANDPFG